MADTYMQIPCAYYNDILIIKSLNARGKGLPKEEAFFNALKASPEIYAELCMGVIEADTRGKLFIVVPYSQKLYDRMCELEPFPSDTVAKKLKSNFLKPTNEEVLRYGY